MRPLLLILLLANLLAFATQFDAIRGLVRDAAAPRRPSQMNAERLRIVRDTSNRTPTAVGEPTDQSISGTNSR